MADRVIATRVPDDLMRKLKKKATAEDRTLAKTVARILREYIQQEEKRNGRKEA